ncbi:tRNA epoxyqueuosine(34) reductase QueG [Proteinivorax hydrogeniformans]|uniref:tRNA epoxyqueuosine(34) reductase QueG n=1 Tax=Proteinivorax hydrogeniformans TaxID=1826727 RepID=A0AAU8HWB2_9FIRM
MDNLKEKIKSKAYEIGFAEIGFVKARKFNEYADTLHQLADKNNYPPFVTEEIEKRTNPFLLMEECKSIISLAVAYNDLVSLSLQHPPDKKQGYITPSAWGEDYHLRLKNMMNKLVAYINSLTKGHYRFLPFVDTGHLSDRHIATLAGIGFCGKNTNLITPSAGSFVWLGHIICNLEVNEDTPVNFDCGSCRKCIESCPVGAIKEGEGLDYSKCLANQLIQKETPLTILNRSENRIYGCDTCQIVCPKNVPVLNGKGGKTFLTEPEWLDLKTLMNISNKEFKNRYGKKAYGWRGKKVLKRNAENIVRQTDK